MSKLDRQLSGACAIMRIRQKSCPPGPWSADAEPFSGFVAPGAFEYSATFKQAVEGTLLEDEYARAILFDYSYRWFYEDGYGKDYQIFNLPESKDSAIQNNSQLDMYLTASMLKYFQQLLIYGDKKQEIKPFNIEKPLWVWVGHSVAGKSKEDSVALSDIARILKFLAEFLKHPDIFQQRIVDLLTKNGAETGLMDDKGYDLFHEAFYHLKQFKNKNNDMTGAIIYDKILRDLFQTSGRGGHLVLERVKGDTGEILLKVSNSTVFFGEINVSGASELCTSLAKNGELTELLEVRAEGNTALPMFDSIKNSFSQPSFFTKSFITYSAIVLLQILPKHTKQILIILHLIIHYYILITL